MPPCRWCDQDYPLYYDEIARLFYHIYAKDREGEKRVYCDKDKQAHEH